MNERIQELALQAQDWADAQAPFASEEHEYFYLKFAQLIVRECADILDNKILPPNHPMNSIGFKLKEHFGVEP